MDTESDSDGYHTPEDGRSTPDQNERSSLDLTDRVDTTDILLQPSPSWDSIDTELDNVISSSMYPIATGGFGDIYRAGLSNHCTVAIKTIRVFESPNPGRYYKWAARELHAWSRCKHPNIVELMGMAVFRGSLAMISMWTENGALPIYLGRNPSADRCLLSVLISRGLAYLHSNSIIHGDLKGNNVLISHDGIPMLNDFGNARIQNATLRFSQSTTGVKLTMRWAAPELFEETALLSYEADVYALGMTMLETFTGDIPYANIKNDQAIMKHIFSNKLPTRPEKFPHEDIHLGDAIWNVLTTCWSYQPTDRPTAVGVEQIMDSLYRRKLAFSRIHGLIIGIDKYKPHVHADLNLGGCADDAKSMLKYFMDFGLPHNRFTCLLDEDATQEEVLDAFENHLINNPDIKPHDPLVVYFVGRGCCIEAPVGWQTTDGKLEIILSHDTKTRYYYERPSDSLVDPAFTHLLHKISYERGNIITSILESRRSGSGTYEGLPLLYQWARRFFTAKYLWNRNRGSLKKNFG
ncbi:unnamed protein product [Rhizoctonia solani]|uniref:Protein kinase domain-containing protein n=1 Tax=Rhizoctonia solani TaxID=456999 RepID=A0A8H3DHG8_9AGAM|nr:unnamed protein product [Rhizoctonia solani]